MKQLKASRCFSGRVEYYSHPSKVTGTEMKFSLFRPAESVGPVPILYWLSGLTCTEDNFTVKSGYQRFADKHGIAVVAPDTSPRGAQIPGEDDSYDFGTGAGFYVDATVAPWSKNYKMYSYVTAELPELVESMIPFNGSRSVFGHSMGGHGALVVALSCEGRYRSVSAFAPIVAPSRVPWGEKAFSGYLGKNKSDWARYDATSLLEAGKTLPPALIDQGSSDEFLESQLKPQLFCEAARKSGANLTFNLREEFDHSYFFITTFMEEHFAFHAKYLWD